MSAKLKERAKAAVVLLFIAALVMGCGPRVVEVTATPSAVTYDPLDRGDWRISTPELQGLDPDIVADLYRDAAQLSNLYGLLIVKNGYLVAEQYFSWRGVDIASPTASVTKSYVSALTGIALREGILTSIDQEMMDFFPEFAGRYDDLRKDQITIRQVLQMRSGYPWEEFSGNLGPLLSSPNWLPLLVEFPLSADPGAEFGYSNLTAHTMGVILARASGTSLRSFGETYLFEPLGVEVGSWPTDASGYHFGSGDVAFTARDMAKFGLLYLNGGTYEGRQIIPSEWVSASLQTYSTGIYGDRLGSYLRQIGYGYLWWYAEAGDYSFNYAWGHGGNLIILVHELDMVVVTTAGNLAGEFGEAAWRKERAIIDLVGGFIASIPGP